MRKPSLTLSPTMKKCLAVLFALLVWQIVAWIVDMDILFASPISVLTRLFTIWREDDFFQTIGSTYVRIAAGFLAALATGFVVAILAGRFRILETMLWPFVVTVKSVPVASFIILCLIWFSYEELTIFTSFLIAFPVIYGNVLQGVKSVPAGMKDMAKLYRIPWGRRFVFIDLMAIKPFLLSACGIAVGMAWKAGVAAEVIGVVETSIGERLYESKIYFQTTDLFAWTVIIVLLSIVTEKLLTFLVKQLFVLIERR